MLALVRLPRLVLQSAAAAADRQACWPACSAFLSAGARRQPGRVNVSWMPDRCLRRHLGLLGASTGSLLALTRTEPGGFGGGGHLRRFQSTAWPSPGGRSWLALRCCHSLVMAVCGVEQPCSRWAYHTAETGGFLLRCPRYSYVFATLALSESQSNSKNRTLYQHQRPSDLMACAGSRSRIEFFRPPQPARRSQSVAGDPHPAPAGAEWREAGWQ